MNWTEAMAEVRTDGMNLRFCKPEFQRDESVVLTAVRQNYQAFQFADRRLRASEVVAAAALSINEGCWEWLHPHLEFNPRFCKRMIQTISFRLIVDLPEMFKSDLEFLLETLEPVCYPHDAMTIIRHYLPRYRKREKRKASKKRKA